MLLSILICTVNKRYKVFSRLYQQITKQLVPGVECIVECDNGENSTGKKRNLLKSRANGEYIVFVDDDDHISKNYIKNILKALQDKPDAVGITGIYTHDYTFKKRFICSNQNKYWLFDDPKQVVRPINHINPVKRQLALQASFPEVYYGEDRFYSDTLKKLVKTEIMAESSLYWYDYRPQLSESIPMDIKDNGKGLKMLQNCNYQI